MPRHEHDADTIDEARPMDDVPGIASANPAVPSQLEYDTPPKEFVAGTDVPADKAPEDMTDAEYIQWMYENLTPFWAIKENMRLRGVEELPAPQLASLEPSEVELGDPDFLLYVTGSNFTAQSVIVFAGHDEPTALNDDRRLSTMVDMDVWHGPDTVKVAVRNGDKVSEPLDFVFAEAGETRDSGDEDDNGKKRRKAKRGK